MTVPILTRTHRATGSPRRCPCGAYRGLEYSAATGARSSWCTACRFNEKDPNQARVIPLLVWSGAGEAGVIEFPIHEERSAA